MADKKIGKLTYRVERLSAFETVKMGRRIANLFGPALPGIIEALRTRGENDEVSDGAALAAMGSLAVSLDDRFDALIKELAEMAEVQWNGSWSEVMVEQEELVQDAGTLMMIAWFVLETNFKSFFSGPLAKVLGGQTLASPKAG